MVADHFQPFHLFGGKPCRSGILPLIVFIQAAGRRFYPGIEVGVDPFRERNELVVLVHGEAHQGHQVGENTAARSTFHFGFFQCSVGLPEL